MLGVDLVKISRIQAAVLRRGEAFLCRFLTQSEREQFTTPQSIAGIWAAKEALSKALGCGISGEFGFLDACVFKDARGKPRVKFSPEFEAKFGKLTAQISISHDSEYAIAVATTSREIL